MELHKNSSGLGVVGVFVFIVVLAVVGLTGWLVSNRSKIEDTQKEVTKTQTVTSEQLPVQESSTSTSLFTLANNKVSFEAPKTWEIEKRPCTEDRRFPERCIDWITLTPDEKKSTVYGSGTEPFEFLIVVYENVEGQTAQVWSNLNNSGLSSDDKDSRDTINGYDTYYFMQINVNYQQLHYTFAAKDKIVLIVARISEKVFTQDNSGNTIIDRDFTEYLPDIEIMANTIKIN